MTLDLTQIKAPPVGASLAARKAALATWLRECLALHAAADGHPWSVATFADPRLSGALGRQDVHAVMGEPARYAEVSWVGQAEGYDAYTPAGRFEVGVYYADDLAPTATAAEHASAQAAFDAVCESTDNAVPGLLYGLRRQLSIETSGGKAALGDPSGVRPGRIPLSRGAGALHACTFTITLA